MSQQQSPLQQLTALGYTVASGAMRFDVAMSMGVSILARDNQGAILQISCSKGILAITAAPAHRPGDPLESRHRITNTPRARL